MARILPSTIDNRFDGHRAAIWLFAIFILIRFIMSFNTVVNADAVATGADGIPLGSFGEPAARRFLSMFRALGVIQFSLVLLGALALLRYKAMIPLLYVLFLFEMVARRLVLSAAPLAREGPPPVGFYLNMSLLAVLIVGLLLSLRSRPGAGTE